MVSLSTMARSTSPKVPRFPSSKRSKTISTTHRSPSSSTTMDLDTALVSIHLPRGTRWRDQWLLHRPSLDANAPPPMRYRPLVKAERDDDGMQRSAMGQQRDGEAHCVCSDSQAVKGRALRGPER